MIYLLIIPLWLIVGFATFVVVRWWQLNHNKYWMDLTLSTANRENIFDMMGFIVMVWPIVLLFVGFEAFVFTKQWWRDFMDRMAQKLFLALKRKE